MLRSRCGRDALVDERPTQVIDACSQQQLGHARSLFDPGGLDIGYPVIEHDPGDGMHLDHLNPRRAGPDIVHKFLHEHGRFGMNKTQGHEFGDAAGLLLDSSNEVYVLGQLRGSLEIPKHHC